MREERNLEPHAFSPLFLSDLSQIRNRHCCKTPQYKISENSCSISHIVTCEQPKQSYQTHFATFCWKAPNHNI